MTKRLLVIDVDDVDITREHRLRRLPGPASASLKNPALRICLAHCAALRMRDQEHHADLVDHKRLAAGEHEED
ncbi:hypothetical protein [Burkholderia plantarii]|uniref:hypothetical protein n=1 Tax=Burkholderia plantarii TaxID=41899 RepID=UPI0018DBA4BD|nr:hypothetical protein [Burkholderia plantarii]MBI0327672.1 hypothetical protein [Burkholderia plantarii]